MSKKRYLIAAEGRVFVERKYGCEWRRIADYDSVEKAIAEHPTAKNRQSENLLARHGGKQ